MIALVVIAMVSYFVATCRSNHGVGKKPQDSTSVQVQIEHDLQHRVDSFVHAVPPVGELGLVVYDATAGKTVYSLNADTPMRPASCMKLLTCIASLRHFGRSADYHTRLYVTGLVVADTLRGNLVLKTQFDPAFNRDSLYRITDTLRVMGIKRIQGKVILDMADYEAMNHEEHWIIGDLRTRYLGLSFTGEQKIRREMLYALARLGIAVPQNDIIRGRVNLSASQKIGEIVTPMSYAIERALKNSSNINAESLLYPLGYIISRQGAFRSNGILALTRFVETELHLPTTAYSIHDGCGLCPEDRLTPRLLARLLLYASQHKYIYKEVVSGLPLSGTDGTLHDRLRKPNVLGKVRAKTGTLTREGGISTLSGYFYSRQGHLIIFVIMNNNCPVMDGRWWQDKFLTKVL